MKKLLFLIVMTAAVCPSQSAAGAGVGIGAKIGHANYSGDVLPSSGDLGAATYYGGVIDIHTMPFIGFEIHANYLTRRFEYRYEYAGLAYSTTFEYQDFSVVLLLKKNLVGLPASPFALYVGAGPGWHLINTEVVLTALGSEYEPSQQLISNPFAVGDPIGLVTDAVRMSGDIMAGARISVPVIPVAVYGETRYGIIFTDENLRSFQVEAGAMLSF